MSTGSKGIYVANQYTAMSCIEHHITVSPSFRDCGAGILNPATDNWRAGSDQFQSCCIRIIADRVNFEFDRTHIRDADGYRDL
jgi:hypothetical protein